MKKFLTYFTRFLVVLTISLSFSSGLWAQKVELSFKEIPIRTILDEVSKQTGYNFVYSNVLAEVDKKIDITFVGEVSDPISKVLDKIFEKSGIIYSISGKQIALRNRAIEQGTIIQAPNQVSSTAQDNRIQIKGVVTDNVTNEPLIGVVVAVKGTNVITQTDIDGQYTIMAPRDAILIFSYVGMTTQEVEVKSRTIISVFMEPDIVTLSEIVVTGYTSLPKNRATGSFATVSSTALETKLQPNLTSVLEGQVAGMAIDHNNKVTIRGVSTLNASKEPLIVVDGFPLDPSLADSFYNFRDGTLENLNTDNIENITVLKDAVSASIYGSRAANGVIVITTKRGKKGEAKFTYKGTFGIAQKPNLANLHKASASDYIDAEIDRYNLNPSAASLNILTYPSIISEVSNLLKQADLGQITQAQAETRIAELRKNNFLEQVQKYLYRNQLINQHNINVNGGADSHSYNVALNYLNSRQDFINTGNDRLTFDLKDQWHFGKRVTFETSVNVAYSTFSTPSINPNPSYSSGQSALGSPTLFNFSTSTYFTPYTLIADENGKALPLFGFSNYKKEIYKGYKGMKRVDYYFLDEVNEDRVNTVDFQTRLTGKFTIDIMKGLNAEIGGNWQRGSYKYQRIRTINSLAFREAYNDSKSKKNPVNHYLPDGDVLDETRNINQSWTFRTQINFNRNFKNSKGEAKHWLNALVGMDISQSIRDNANLGTRVGYNEVAGSFVPMNILDYNSTVYANDMLIGRRIPLNQGSYTYGDNRFVSWYGNGSYEYDGKYLITGSIRLDLTNFFGTDPKYRYRPLWSAGGTWKLSEEGFFDAPWMNRLHIRGSYGINGNIALNQGPFLILAVGDYNSGAKGISYSISSPPNDQLRWEKTRSTNIGVDLSLFNNRLDLSLDLYDKYSTDVLASDAVDVTTGFTSLMKNVGKISNQGIEVVLGTTIISNRNFSWRLTHNFAYNRSRILEYNVNRPYSSSYTIRGAIQVEGYPANTIWGYKWAPLNNTGTAMVYDSQGDRILATLAQKPEDVYCLGSVTPKFDLALTNRFTYGDWELSFMFIAKLGHIYRKDAFQSQNFQNRHVAERWRQPGDEAWAIYPALSVSNADYAYSPFMDIHVGNASFAKLRDLTLTYNIPRMVVNKIGLNMVKTYIQGRNLFTIKHKDTDIDPETFIHHSTGSITSYTDQAYSTLPLPREVTIGLQITF